MNFSFYDFLGSAGTVLIIGTYVFLQLGKIKSETFLYSFLNAAGASLILISLLHSFNFSAFIVEFFWMLISVFGIVKYCLRRKNDR